MRSDGGGIIASAKSASPRSHSGTVHASMNALVCMCLHTHRYIHCYVLAYMYTHTFLHTHILKQKHLFCYYSHTLTSTASNGQDPALGTWLNPNPNVNSFDNPLGNQFSPHMNGASSHISIVSNNDPTFGAPFTSRNSPTNINSPTAAQNRVSWTRVQSSLEKA